MSKSFEERIFRIVLKKTNFPGEVVNIVLGYVIIPAGQQYAEKYDRKNIIWKSRCYRIDDKCSVHFSTEEKYKNFLFEDNKCENCKRSIIWYPFNFHLQFCSDCKERSSIIILDKKKQEKEKEKNINFEACTNCNKIAFCSVANSDSDICLMTNRCKFCKIFCCKHGVHTRFSNDKETCICKNCATLF
jgi:hypothetical protein